LPKIKRVLQLWTELELSGVECLFMAGSTQRTDGQTDRRTPCTVAVNESVQSTRRRPIDHARSSHVSRQ